jgi:hypothetical protein
VCFALAVGITLAALALSLLRDPHPDTAAQWESARQQVVLAGGCWVLGLLLWGVVITWSVYRTSPERQSYLLPRRAQVIIGLLPLLILGLILADIFQSLWRQSPAGYPDARNPAHPSRAPAPPAAKPVP